MFGLSTSRFQEHLPVECLSINPRFSSGRFLYLSDARLFSVRIAKSVYLPCSSGGRRLANSRRPEAAIQAAETSRGVFGISGSSKSQYGIRSAGNLGCSI